MTDVSGVQTTPTAATQTAANELNQNFEMFLTLLTEQMKNQDPLNPQDSQEFVNQLVQFSGVEQQINMNENLETLLILQSAAAQTSAVGYIGRYATASTDQAQLADGQAVWDYDMPSDATEATIIVKNAAGDIVAREDAELAAGKHSFVWDGEQEDGSAAPDGIYSIEVLATDADGETVEASIQATGKVTSVDLSGSEVVVSMGGIDVPLSLVRSIRSDLTQ